jgi:hypothetical protein
MTDWLGENASSDFDIKKGRAMIEQITLTINKQRGSWTGSWRTTATSGGPLLGMRKSAKTWIGLDKLVKSNV